MRNEGITTKISKKKKNLRREEETKKNAKEEDRRNREDQGNGLAPRLNLNLSDMSAGPLPALYATHRLPGAKGDMRFGMTFWMSSSETGVHAPHPDFVRPPCALEGAPV